MQRKFLFVLNGMLATLFFFLFFTSANATYANPCDPLEKINRPIFVFNEWLDKLILCPVAKIYRIVVPKPIVRGISNIFDNFDMVPTVANDVLQGHFYQATSDSWRLMVNTTLGIGGFFDVATCIGLHPNYEDLGLTFAHWGWKCSTYIVLPFFGPTTIRDAIAMPINYQYFTIYPYIHPVSYRYGLYALGVVNYRASLLHFQNVFNQCALDKYIFMRDAWLQKRHCKICENVDLGNPCKRAALAQEPQTTQEVVVHSDSHA